ncbi:MAG: CoA transferase [Acidimicrobiales bacterium]
MVRPSCCCRWSKRPTSSSRTFGPGSWPRYGLDYETLRAVNPRVIMLSVSGFGQTSSHAGRAAFAPVLHAESGLLARQAFFDEVPPVDPVLSIADTNAALHGLVGVLAALHLRSTTGTGQHIDMAMLNAMTVTDDYAHNALDAAKPFRLGGEVWETGFGHMLIAANSKVMWFMLRKGDRLDDGLRPDAAVEVKAAKRQQLMTDWFKSFTERSALIAELDALNVAYGDVLAPGEVFDTDIALERRLSTTVDDRAGGRRRVTESPYHFSNASSRVAGPAPHRGEHHAEVLGEWIGASPERIAELEAAGILLLDEHAAAHRSSTGNETEEQS